MGLMQFERHLIEPAFKVLLPLVDRNQGGRPRIISFFLVDRDELIHGQDLAEELVLIFVIRKLCVEIYLLVGPHEVFI